MTCLFGSSGGEVCVDVILIESYQDKGNSLSGTVLEWKIYDKA